MTAGGDGGHRWKLQRGGHGGQESGVSLLCDPAAVASPQFLWWYNEILDCILLKVFDSAQSPKSRAPVKNGALGSHGPGFKSSLSCCVTLSKWLHVSEPRFSHPGMSYPPSISNGDYVSMSLWRTVGRGHTGGTK